MYRRDYLLKQIEEFAQMLARLLKANGLDQKDDAREILDDAYKVFLNSDASVIKETVKISPDKIQERFKYKNEQMEFLAHIFFEESLIFNEDKDFAEASLSILKYLNEKQKLFSFERERLIERIELFLS